MTDIYRGVVVLSTRVAHAISRGNASVAYALYPTGAMIAIFASTSSIGNEQKYTVKPQEPRLSIINSPTIDNVKERRPSRLGDCVVGEGLVSLGRGAGLVAVNACGYALS